MYETMKVYFSTRLVFIFAVKWNKVAKQSTNLNLICMMLRFFEFKEKNIPRFSFFYSRIHNSENVQEFID